MEASQASEAGSIPVARSSPARPRAGRFCYAHFAPTVYRMRRDNRRNTLPARATARGSGTKLAQLELHGATSGTKLAQHAQNPPIWRVLCTQGEFCTVFVTNKPSMANFVPLPPATRPARHHSRYKTRPASAKKPNLGCFELAGRTFSRPARQLLKIKTFKAMTTYSHCPRETAGTNARLPELTNETAITIASPQHPKNQHFPRAKVSTVSNQHSLGPAKVSPVSSRRSSALDTAPMHQIAQHCTSN